MDDLLDQDRTPQKFALNHKRINTFLLLIPLLLIVFTISLVQYDRLLIVSPFVPKYIAIHANATLINYTVIQVLGLLPAIYLRFGKFYKRSTIALLVFMILGTIVKNWVAFHELFY